VCDRRAVQPAIFIVRN